MIYLFQSHLFEVGVNQHLKGRNIRMLLILLGGFGLRA